MEYTLSLLACKYIYEKIFKKPLPSNLPYMAAAKMAYDKVGRIQFEAKLKEVNERIKNELR